MVEKTKDIIGRADVIDLPDQGLFGVPAKIDTGARTSAIWASHVQERDGGLAFVLFGPKSSFYSGEEHFADEFQRVAVASSTGHQQIRYKVKLMVIINGRRIRASFTLADRSRQAYPVLIGRRALHGKFVVDVQMGRPDHAAERQRADELRSEFSK